MIHRITLFLLLIVIQHTLMGQGTPGFLDTTFNQAGPKKGIYTLPGQTTNKSARAVAIDKDGKIIVGITAYSPDTITLARILRRGSIDSSFGTNGYVKFNTFPFQAVNSILIQPDNKILVAGYKTDGTNSDMLVIRFLPNGAIDNSFDGDGMVTIDSSSNDVVRAIKLDAQGKIVLVGESASRTAVVRLNINGSADPGFSGDGFFKSSSASTEAGYGITFKDNRIYVAASYLAGSYSNFRVYKLLPDGTPDSSFGASGVSSIPSTSNDTPLNIFVQENDDIIIGGSSYSNFKVVGLSPDGVLNSGFTTYNQYAAPMTGMIRTEDEGFVLSGSAYCAGGNCLKIRKIDKFGALDSLFGMKGSIDISGSTSTNGYAAAMSPDDKLVIAGDDNFRPTVFKIEAGSAMHIVGTHSVLPGTFENFKIEVPPTWSYTYHWTYSGNNVLFLGNSSGPSITLFFSDSATNGKLKCTAYSGSYPYATIEKNIFVYTDASDAFQLSKLTCPVELTDCGMGTIEDFQLGSISNIKSGCSDEGYSDFTRTAHADTLAAGGVYSALVTVYGLEEMPRYVGIWIDYNNDGTFNSSDEFVAEGFSFSSVVKVNNIILRNEEGYTGPKRLRIRARPESRLFANEACAVAGEYGETEDYMVVLDEQNALEAPQIITPNDDGKNDYLAIRGIDPQVGNKLTIFDRWGEVKFSTDNYQNNWNGISDNGEKLVPGTYYFVFTTDDDFVRGFLEIRY